MALAAASLAAPAQAQVALPEITVTAPSPVVRRAPAAPKQGQAPAQAQVPASPELAELPLPPGLVEQVFVPLTVVPSIEVLAAGGANLSDSLQHRPGISASTFAPGASRPVIRGMDNTRVSVRENGLGSHDASSVSEDHAVPIDPFAADQIEVVRGPATLRYGSGAIAGVVNASNQRIPEFVPRNGYNAEIRGGVGSDQSVDGGFKVTAGAGNVAVHADHFWRSAEDYRTPRGRQFNSFLDSDNFAMGASLIGHGGFVGVSFSQFNSLYGIPGKDAETERKRIDMQQNKVQSRGEWRVHDYGVEAIRFWFGGSSYRHNEIGFENGPPDVGSRFTNHELEGRVEVQHLPIGTALGELRGAVGVQLGKRDFTGRSFEGDDLLEPTVTRSAAVFWFEELQLTRRLRLQAATRLEQTSVDGTGLDLSDPANPASIRTRRDFTPFSGSFGALYQLPNDVVARATAQYAERAPEASELFSKGPHEATGTFEIGNPNLNKEVAQSFEVGLKRARGAFRFDASAYYTAFDGFIFKQRSGETCDDDIASCTPSGAGSELNQVFFRQRNARFYGVELSGAYDVGRLGPGVWGIDAQYDFVNAKFTDSAGGYVPRIPPHRAGAGVFYRDAHWYARTGFLHAFDQTLTGENETSTKGYTLLNADLSYTWKVDAQSLASPVMTIGIKGDNLLDEDVRNHVSFKKDDVLQPGRTVRLYGVIKLN